MNTDILNVVFSSDNNYAQHMGVVIYSLLKFNSDFSEINLFIIDNNILEDNKKRLTQVASKFDNAAIVWIPFERWKEKLKVQMDYWTISISAYARLFVGSMLGESVERVLYLDCDMLIQRSLKELWKTSLDEYVVAAVQDAVGDATKSGVGLSADERYFNSGMLLINLRKWRELGIEQKCLKFIKEKDGNVLHHDQGVLNGVLKGKWFRLPIENNLMTINYIFDRERLISWSGEHAGFYSAKEISKAIESPVILHYTPSFTSRPWCKGCVHPLRNLYWRYLSETPWHGEKPVKSNDKWYVRLINWKYRHFYK